MLRPTLLCVVLLALPGHQLATKYVAESRVEIESTLEYTLATTEFSMERDGEPVQAQGFGSGESTQKSHGKWIDHVVAVSDGKPTKVRRTFSELAQATSMRMGENEREVEFDTPLEGLTLELSSGAEAKVEAEVVDGTAPSDSTLLDGHALTLQLDALLPTDAVEENGSWDLDSDAIRTALGIALQNKLYVRPDAGAPAGGEEGGQGRRGGFGGGGGGARSRIFELAEWKGKATLQGEEDVDGTACWIVKLEISAEGELPAPEPRAGGRRGDQVEFFPGERGLANTFEIKLDGALNFAKNESRPQQLELEGSIRIEMNSERTRQEVTTRTHSVQEGKLEIGVEVRPVEAAKEEQK
jgi:hypothetical protein